MQRKLRMRIKLNALRVLLLLIVVQGESKAAKCYQCHSKQDKNCTINTVDMKYLKPCPSSKPFCRKAVYIYYFTDSREYITIRECAKWHNADKECYRGRYTHDSYQLVCECKGAGCNRSSSFSSESILFLCIFCQIVIFLTQSDMKKFQLPRQESFNSTTSVA